MSNKLIKKDLKIERGQRLKFLRDMTGMSGEKFAHHCGVARSTITGWETGANGLTERGARKVLEAMKKEGITCNILWLLHGVGMRPKITDQNKLSRLHYPDFKSEFEQSVQEPSLEEGMNYFEEIALFKKQYTDHLIYTLPDDSMSPIYQAYDCVGGYKLSHSQLELAQGKICIVLLKGEHAPLVRRIKLEGASYDKISLYVINAEASLHYPPLYQMPMDAVIGVAPIIRMWRNT